VRVVAVFLLAVSVVFLILSEFYMIAVTVEGAIFKSLQTVARDCPPSILLITSVFSSTITDLRSF
jgi:hypothetical protein